MKARGVAGGKQGQDPPPPWHFIPLVFGVFGMTFEEKVRKLSDKFCKKFVWGELNSLRGGANFLQNFPPLTNLTLRH